MSHSPEDLPPEPVFPVREETRTILTLREGAALLLSAAWLVATGSFFYHGGLQTGSGSLTVVMALLAVFLPILLIWALALMSRSLHELRAQTGEMHQTLANLRKAQLQLQQNSAAGQTRPVSELERKLEQIAAAQRQTEQVIATFTSTRSAPAPAQSTPARAAPPAATYTAPAEAEPGLALEPPADPAQQPLTHAEFIRALNFPDDAGDAEGIAALRRALANRDAAKLIRSAQDVLTLLAQDGVYMDDLTPDQARPELWRRFAEGERGRTMAALGGIRDRTSLAICADRMRADPVFRDAAHHFLRQYDRSFTDFAQEATDAELSALGLTRTTRAFMLLGRVSGTFD